MSSSDEEGGSQDGEAAAAEEAALASLFLRGEPGSPDNAQLLQLLAAPPPAPGSLLEGLGRPAPLLLLPPGPVPRAPGDGMPSSSTAPAGGAAASEAPSTPATSDSSQAPAGGAEASARALSLRVVRSDEQEALQRAMAELERRCGAVATCVGLPRVLLHSCMQAGLAAMPACTANLRLQGGAA